MDTRFAITEYPDAAAITAQLDALIKKPIYSINRAALKRYEEEYFEKKCAKSKEMITEEGKPLSNEVEHIDVTFKYDLQSFFNYFDWINVSQFAKKAGINESKMRQYKNGLAFAGESTTKKILDTIKNIGAELQSATL